MGGCNTSSYSAGAAYQSCISASSNCLVKATYPQCNLSDYILTSATDVVQSITVWDDSKGNMGKLQINSLTPIVLTKDPESGCGIFGCCCWTKPNCPAGNPNTLILSASQKVTKVSVWSYNRDYTSTDSGCSPQSETFVTQIAFDVGTLPTTTTYTFGSIVGSFITQYSIQYFFAGFRVCGSTCDGFQQLYVADHCLPPTTPNLSSFVSSSYTSTIMVSSMNSISLSSDSQTTATSPSCPSLPIQYQITNISPTPPPSLISYPSSPSSTPPTLVMNPTSDRTLTSSSITYTFTLTVSYQDISQTLTSSATGTFSYFNPCSTTTLPSFTISNQNLTLFQTASIPATSILTAFSTSRGSSSEMCGAFSWSVSSVPSQTFITIDPSNGAITISPTLIGHVGSYIVTVTSQLSEYCPAPSSCIKKTSTFKVDVLCVVQSLTVVQQSDGGGLVDQSATLATAFNYALKTQQVPNCAFSVTSYTITSDLDPISQSTTTGYTLSASDIPLTATNLLVTSPHIVTIQDVTLSDGSTIAVTATNFKLTFHHPCEFTTINSQTIGPINFAVFDAAPTGTNYAQFTEFTDSAGVTFSLPTTLCGARSYTFSIGQNQSGNNLSSFLLNSPGNSFLAFSDNMNQIGTYTAVLTISLVDYSTITKTVPFQVTVFDPCLNTVLSIAILNPITTSVLASAVNQQVLVTDSISQSFGGGSQLCGLISYDVTSSALTSPSNLQASECIIDSSGMILLSPSLNSEIGTIQISVVTKLINYPSVTQATSSFVLTVQPCIVTNLSFIASPLSVSYSIFSTQVTQVYTDSIMIQTPLCGYSIDFTFTSIIPTPATTFMVSQTFSTNLISLNIESQDRYNLGVYSLSFSAMLNSYTYAQNSVSNEITINLIDPCYGTTILPFVDPIEDLTAFQGFQTPSLVNYTYHDTVSDIFSSPAPVCGPFVYLFTLQSPPLNSQLKISQAGQITFQPSYETQLKDSKVQATLIVSLQLYPAIQSVQNFYVTTLSCKVQQIEDVSWASGSGSLSIKYQEFEVTPAYAPKDLILSYDSSLIDGTGTSEELPPFIQFNPAAKDWQVQAQLIGTYNVVLVSTFDQFPNAQCNTTFKVTISPSIIYLPKITSMPKIDFSSQQYFIEQCPEQKDLPILWSTKLPIPYSTDDNATIASENVSVSSTYLTFNPITRLVSQTQFVGVERTDTVTVELIDSNGFSSVSFFKVIFGCPITNPTLLNAIYYQEQMQARNKTQRTVAATIDKIMFNGTVIITFNTTMNVPDNSSRIQYETVTINDTSFPVLELKVLPGKYSSPNLLTFQWKFRRFQPRQLVLDIIFDNPDFVSINAIKDQLQVTVYGFYLFSDIQGNVMSPEYMLQPKRLPLIVSDTEQKRSQVIGSYVTSATTGFFASSFVISMLLAGVLQQILSSVKQLQIQTHLMLFRITIPANAQIFYSFIMQVVALDYLNFDNLLENQMGMDDSSPLTDSFSVLGYSSLYSLRNFGSLIIFFIGPPILAAALRVIVNIFWQNQLIKSLQENLNRKVFFNGILDFLNETYILLCMACFLNTYQFQFDTLGHAINSFTCVVFGITVLVLPIFFLTFYYYNFQLVMNRDKSFMTRFGGLLQDLNYFRNGNIVIQYRVLTMIRKLILAGTCVYLQNYPVFSIISVNFQTLAMITVVGHVQPFIQGQTNNLELLNEIFTLLINYHLISFTDFVANPSTRKIVGSSLIFTGLLNIVINVGMIVYSVCFLGARKLKFLYLSQKQKINIKRQQNKLSLREKSDGKITSQNATKYEKSQIKVTTQFDLDFSSHQYEESPLPSQLKALQSQYQNLDSMQQQVLTLIKTQKFKLEKPGKYQVALKPSLKSAFKRKYPIQQEVNPKQPIQNQQIELQQLSSHVIRSQEKKGRKPNYDGNCDQGKSFNFNEEIQHIQKFREQVHSLETKEQVAVNFDEIESGLFNAQRLFKPGMFDQAQIVQELSRDDARKDFDVPARLTFDRKSAIQENIVQSGDRQSQLKNLKSVVQRNLMTSQAAQEFEQLRREQMIKCLRRN